MNGRLVSVASLNITALLGCSTDPHFVVIARQNPSEAAVGPIRIVATPVDTARLPEEHPFCWHGKTLAGFMVFDVKTINTSGRDLLCMFGHLDFPGVVAPAITRQHLIDPASPGSGDGATLVSTDQLAISQLAHEKAVVLTEQGMRHPLLDYLDFQQRYHYLMNQEMKKARGWGHVPYIGGFIAAKKMEEAGDNVQERWLRAQQAVLRPGVVPAGQTVRGYVVFAWAEDIQPGGLTLRLPVQPGHAATFQYDVRPAADGK